MYRYFFKRIIDLTISLTSIVLLMPVILIIAILVWLKLGSPVLFTQKRIGKDGKAFLMYKFRSMRNTTDSDGNLLPDEKRLTGFGAWLRSTSLDELPGLWCVIKGGMSLVGPRPLLPEYMEYYSKTQHRRHEVKPGITGWAQINGRNAQSWEDRLNYDVWYVDHYSFLLDLKIIYLTFIKVFKKEGISAKNNVTMVNFSEYMRKKNKR